RHGIHAQPIHMVFLEPEQGRGHEETADLAAAEVENGGIPFRMKSLARIRVLVEVRAVEKAQSVLVGGKVRWHPIENHADASGVQMIDEVHKVLGRAIACGGRKIAGGLIAPRSVERMLGNRHEFNMREAELIQIIAQRMRKLAVGKKVAVLAA